MNLVVGADKSAKIERISGEDKFGDKVPHLEVTVSEVNWVSVKVNEGESNIAICPIQLTDGSVRKKVFPEEPEPLPRAYYLLKITNSNKQSAYYQFDKEGNILL